MKYFIIIALMLMSSTVLGQEDSLTEVKLRNLYFDAGGCEWVCKEDTIKIDYVLVIDDSGYVRMKKGELITVQYEVETCDEGLISFYPRKRNEVSFLDGVPAEILIYKVRGQEALSTLKYFW